MQKPLRRSLIPRFIDQAVRRGEFKGEISAATMLADISGFTALTQAMMEHGVEGAEVVAELINRVFTPAIEAIEQQDGFVAGFAGDAFTAIFPGGSLSALVAADLIRRQFREQGVQRTKFGEFPLSVHIGVSHGTVEWRIITTPHQHAYWFTGEALKRSGECEQRAKKGQIIFDSFLFLQLPDTSGLEYRSLPDEYLLLASVPKVETSPPISHAPLRQAKFIPQVIRQMKSPGEFREVLACFINLRADDPSELVGCILPLCRRFGGYFKEVDFSDKGWVVVVLFGAPTTQDKTTQRAAEFALEVKRLAGGDCRIGLTLGRAFAGFVGSVARCTYAAVGSSVNLAARLMNASSWAEILVGSRLVPELQEHYEIASAGVLTLKGFTVPLKAHSLVAKKETGFRRQFTGWMVGREAELQSLHRLAAPIFKGRFAGIVNIYGAAGMGKSRLAAEFTEGLRERARVFLLQCDGILKQPYNPWVYFIRQFFGDTFAGIIQERRSRFRENWSKFAGKIVAQPDGGSMVNELARIESIIAALLGLEWEGSVYVAVPGKDKPVVTRFALKSLVRALTMEKPVILLSEDLHWIDAESAAVFTILTREIQNLPLLIVAVSRYNDDGSKPGLPVDKSVLQNSIDLETLTNAETEQLVASVLEKPAEDELVQFLFGRSEGNPFYAEQIALYLRETGGMEVREERYALKTRTIELPLGIDSLLIARLDRLEAGLKDVVQTASVIGREFAVKVLSELLLQYHHVTRAKEAFARTKIAPQLKRGEEERVWNAASEIAYIFSHSLLRDAAYNMQLKKRLTELHRLTAETLQRLFPDDKEMFYEIAEHYAAAEEFNNALIHYDNAGDYYNTTFKFGKALESYEKGLKIRLNTLGEKHPDTAEAYYKIGTADYGKGGYEKAMEYYLKALNIRLETLGENHPDTASLYGNIGVVHHKKGNYEKALENQLKALNIQLETLGEKHPDTAKSYMNIGNVQSVECNYEKAMEFYLKTLNIRLEILGDKHPDTAMSYHNVGEVYFNKGDYKKALEHYIRALNISLETLGDKHPNTANTYNNIGNVQWKEGDYDKALECHLKALNIRLEILGETHPDTADSYFNIGLIGYEKGDYDTAIEYYLKALNIDRETRGEKHPFIAMSYGNIGNVHLAKGDYKQALEYHRSSLNIFRATLGVRHPDTALSYHNIGNVQRKGGDYERALENLLKALDIRLEILGENHLDTASSFFCIGDTHYAKGDYEKALEYRLRALKIHAEKLGEKHPHTLQDYRGIIQGFVVVKEFEKAEEYLTQWNEICRKHQLTEHTFDLEFLKAKLAFARQPDAACIERILALLTGDLTSEQTAELYWEAARMQRELGLSDAEHRAEANRIYRELYAKTPNYEYKKRFEALEG
jgi:tetratricopeptide (TPR) repeat protein/class 3 adenylate cyclase